jgi:hypothetical protein
MNESKLKARIFTNPGFEEIRMSDIRDAVRTVEQHAPAGGDQHTHNFNDVYKELSKLQTNDGGANSTQFKQDLVAMNQQLHQDGVIPNLEITGIDSNHHILTKNIADNTTQTQDASRVNDAGGIDTSTAQGMRDQMLAKAFGINVDRNADGSYDVNMPQANVGNVLNTIMNGMLGTGGGDQGGDNPAPMGMNPLMAQAWKGWGDQPAEDPTPDPDAP